MGHSISKLYEKFFNTVEMKILMLGLDAAGKTSILRRLTTGTFEQTIPTIGFNIQTIKFKKVKFTMWDLSGSSKIQELWMHYFAGVQGLIFVIDSSNRDRIPAANDALQTILQREELKDSIVLVFASKKDQSQIDNYDLKEILALDNHPQLKWFIQGCSAVNGEGLSEGLEWLQNQIAKK